jgi:pimeloyl-ACP methyl ester carboxylesterase
MLDKYEAPPEALVLIDAAAYKTRFPFFVSFLRAPLLGGLLLALTTSAFQARYTLKKLYFQKMCVTEKRVERYARFMSLPGHRRTMIETAKQIVPSAFREYIDRYRDLDMPALVLWGRHDPAISLSCGRKLSEELPRGTLSVIEDSGHNPQEERPERTAEAINRFLMQ